MFAEEKLQNVTEINLFLVIYRSVSRGSQVWAPEGSTAFKCLLSARFCAALLSNISDCDETFNYWEPVSTNLKRLKCAALSSVHLRGLAAHNNAALTVLTDALLAVRHGDADVGVFASVRHQVIRLLMATRSPGLFACTRSTDKQGNFINVATCCEQPGGADTNAPPCKKP